MIFGTGEPKFTYEVESVITTINMNYVVVEKDEPDFDYVEHKSVLNGHREIYEQGTHWVFEIILNLFKYSDPKSKLNQFFAAKPFDLILYRHSDGNPFQDADGTTVYFKLVEIEPFYLETVEFRDKVRLKFISKDYIDMSKLLTTEINLEDLIQEGEVGGIIEE